jgi:hypothetical protein
MRLEALWRRAPSLCEDVAQCATMRAFDMEDWTQQREERCAVRNAFDREE